MTQSYAYAYVFMRWKCQKFIRIFILKENIFSGALLRAIHNVLITGPECTCNAHCEHPDLAFAARSAKAKDVQVVHDMSVKLSAFVAA